MSEHKFSKGIFTTPFYDFFKDRGKTRDWFLTTYPEVIWLGLILNSFERTKGMLICADILQFLENLSEEYIPPFFSEILNLDSHSQSLLYEFINLRTGKNVLKPLTAIFPYTQAVEFNKVFNNSESLKKTDLELLIEVVKLGSNHQSNFSTDLRYLIIYTFNLKNLVTFGPKEAHRIDELNLYPILSHTDEKMRSIRPFIRATEIAISSNLYSNNTTYYLEKFWQCMNELTDCEVIFIKNENENRNMDDYKSALYSVMSYIKRLNETILMFDSRATVMSGIVTFSWKRLIELIDHNLHNTISGRSIIRNLIENLIMMKYLLLNEKNNPDIWNAYKNYGYGQYKLVSERFIERQVELPDSHVPYKLLDILCQEKVRKEFLPMHTNYFNSESIREKANKVGCSELYGLYYDYDSSFEHSLWGAIRESSLLLCNNPSHQYHVVPDIENEQCLTSVLHDCMDVFYKMVKVFEEVYKIPENLLERIKP